MTLPAPEDTLFDALLLRDVAYDGLVFACVTSTGIYCRLSCPARKPKRKNVEFRDSVEACKTAGFRACKRCHPDLVRPADAP